MYELLIMGMGWILDSGYWILDAGCWIVTKELQHYLLALCFLPCFAWNRYTDEADETDEDRYWMQDTGLFLKYFNIIF